MGAEEGPLVDGQRTGEEPGACGGVSRQGGRQDRRSVVPRCWEEGKDLRLREGRSLGKEEQVRQRRWKPGGRGVNASTSGECGQLLPGCVWTEREVAAAACGQCLPERLVSFVRSE